MLRQAFPVTVNIIWQEHNSIFQYWCLTWKPEFSKCISLPCCYHCICMPKHSECVCVQFKPWSCAAGRLPGKKYFDHPDYAHINIMWHPTKNGTKTPGDCTHGSRQRVWLQCSGCPRCDDIHEWQAKVQDLTRLRYKVGCLYCESRGGSFCQCRSIKNNTR